MLNHLVPYDPVGELCSLTARRRAYHRDAAQVLMLEHLPGGRRDLDVHDRHLLNSSPKCLIPVTDVMKHSLASPTLPNPPANPGGRPTPLVIFAFT